MRARGSERVYRFCYILSSCRDHDDGKVGVGVCHPAGCEVGEFWAIGEVKRSIFGQLVA